MLSELAGDLTDADHVQVPGLHRTLELDVNANLLLLEGLQVHSIARRPASLHLLDGLITPGYAGGLELERFGNALFLGRGHRDGSLVVRREW